MSGYPIDDDDDVMDNYYDSDSLSSTSNFRFNKYTADFGKPITITMPNENIDKLQYESETKQMSFNTKINQIIKNHRDWYSNTPPANMSCIPKPIVTKAIGQLTEQQTFRVRTIHSRQSPRDEFIVTWRI